MATENPTIPPGIRPGETPPFYELNEYTFQDLCRDLFDFEPPIATCDVYGVRGQSQDGIDLLAQRTVGDGIELGQCKCCKEFSAANIRSASDDFFEHWRRWSKENVKRFILFVACDLNDRKTQDEIISQRARFAARQMSYEVWSGAKIRNKLRPHQGVVATYLAPAEYWVRIICGTITTSGRLEYSPSAKTVTIVETALVTEIDQLSSHVKNATERRIERMRTLWREGRLGEVETELTEVKNDTVLWNILPAQTRAKLLRFESSWILEKSNDVVHATALANQSQALDPSQNLSRLRSLITYREKGAEEALVWLDGQQDVDSLNLKAALLLELGRTQEARAVLEFEGDSDGES